MSDEEKKPKNYEPAPQVPAEMAERYRTIQEVIAGSLTVSEGSRRLGLSRNHFQTLLHRAEKAMLESMTPKPAGRPARPRRELELENELERLQRENEQLRLREQTMTRLLDLAANFSRSRARTKNTKATKTTETPNEPEEPDGGWARALWAEAVHLVTQGSTTALAARLIGASPATLGRWGRRVRHHQALKQRPGPGPRALPSAQVRASVESLVRQLDGQIGAAAIAKRILGLSRREAARLKRHTLTNIELERKAHARRVLVTMPDVIRGFDPVFATSAQGRCYLMPVSDAAVPKRTTVDLAQHYDADAVCRVLAADIAANGPPLVYRMDRARQHDDPKVRALLDRHGVLLLHGPPHHPQYYGQLERQNREHRVLLDTLGPLPITSLAALCCAKVDALDTLWPRRRLGWRTSQEVWDARSPLKVDRVQLRQEVERMTNDLLQQRQVAPGFPAGMAERLAIEAALSQRGFLSLSGGRC